MLDTGDLLLVAGYKLQGTSCRIQDAGYRMQACNLSLET